MALIHLVYVSRRTPALGADELKRIVAQSTRRNRAREITGVLLCCGEHVMQLLEGEQAVVDATFERIRNDPRHQDVQLLLHKPVGKRLFPESRMALAELHRRFRLDRGRLIHLVDYVRTSEDTSLHTVETRILLSDFHQQLNA
jgi:hypothetical protein